MNYKVIPTPRFKRQAKKLLKKYSSLSAELQAFEQDLMANPEQGQSLGQNTYVKLNKNLMSRTILIMMLLCMSLSVMAQEKSGQQEIGLAFSNLDNFGLTFKTGTRNAMWRLNTLLVSGSDIEEISESEENSQNTIGFGIGLGREYRKEIIEHLELRYGADLSFRYNKTEQNRIDKLDTNNDSYSKRITYQPGINLVLGLNYVINNTIVIGAELLPNFTYISGEQTQNDINSNEEIKTDISGFSYGLSNTSALLTLSYRF